MTTATDKNPQEESDATPVVAKDSKLITAKRKYFYPGTGKTVTRAAKAPAVKTKDTSTNEETK